jgi:riboflavin biosynthesis pyrimidine reductase
VILVGAGTARAEKYAPVRPEPELARWAWLRRGRTPSPPIAVVTRRLDLDTGSPLLAAAPGHARTIIVTTAAAPARRRAAAAAHADVVVAGEAEVDMRAAIEALAVRGHTRILTEGGPHLLSQIVGAGLLGELCLTISPLLAGPGAYRIVEPMGPAGQPAAVPPTGLALAHVLADEGHLLCRYLRPGAVPGHPY